MTCEPFCSGGSNRQSICNRQLPTSNKQSAIGNWQFLPSAPALKYIRFCVVVFGILATSCRSISAPLPPGQPASGPGGADYAHASVITERFGEGDSEYWIFAPADPVPAEAPLVFFLHGWAAMNPRAYGAWIEHIVRKGHIVVYPRYQARLLTAPDTMTANALGAAKAAWTELNANGPVKPRQDQVAYVSHSLGGLISANLASLAVENGLPPAAAFMAAAPGGETSLALRNLTNVPSNCLCLLVVGDADTNVGDLAAKMIKSALPQITSDNIDFVTVRSDRRSSPKLIADHFAPLATLPTFPPQAPDLTEAELAEMNIEQAAPRDRRRLFGRGRLAQGLNRNPHPPDALDYYGYWKLADGLLDAAFRGTHREYALGNTSQQRFMGRLSDGSAVAPLVVTEGH